MRTPPISRKARSRAPPTPCARSRPGTAATTPRRPAAPTASSTATTIRSAQPAFDAKVKLLEDHRRLCPRQGPARAAGHGQPRRHLAGGRNPARRRRDLSRHPPAGAAQRLGRGRRRRPPGNRQLRLRRPRGLSSASSTTDAWQGAVDEALRQALVNLDAVAAPAGEMDVVLGPGWPGVMLHEAVGHGLEGDFNRKKTSAFAGLMGQRVAAKGVTVVDDGTMQPAPRLALDRRRGHADQPHRADRGRHPGRLHAGPAERAADGHEADRQRPARESTPTCRCRA